MTIREDILIERIRKRIPSSRSKLLRVGIGDDAAVLRTSPGMEWVLTCDQFIEGVHFLAGVHPPNAVGYKALARATSDIAAMGARPRLFLLGMALPAARTGRWLDGMLGGMARAAKQLGLTLAGGDTARATSAKGGVALGVTVLGEIRSGQAVRRSGARPGDAVFVTGQLGAAQLGLELVLRGMHRQARWHRFLAAHYYPKIQVELGQWLARRGLVSAMMDLSDGLSTDLSRLCRASGVGSLLYGDKIPAVLIPKGLQKIGDARQLALHGGEDYGLLFTVPERSVVRIPRAMYGTRITRIGEIVAGRGVRISGAGGRASKLAPRGWDHFKTTR